MSALFEIQSSTRVTIAGQYFLAVFQKAGVDAIALSSAKTTTSLDAMPTRFPAMADSRIGGKSSIKLEPYKNLGDATQPLLTFSLNPKKWFIGTKEFDQADRLPLYFGHTFGHAIEGAAHFRISHKIAVAVGILCALASASPGLKSEMEALSVPKIVQHVRANKRHKATQYRFILPGAAIGSVA